MFNSFKTKPIALFAAVLGGSIVVNLILSFVIPLDMFAFWTRFFLGLIIAGIGGAYFYWVLIALEKGGVMASLKSDPPGLLTGGPYALQRNPLYTALAVLYFGVAILFNAPLALLALIGLMVYVAKVMVPAEESALSRLFGAAYETYCGQVNRWM